MSCWCHALFWYINTCVISGSPYLCLWVDLSKEICALTDPIIPSPTRRGSFYFTWDHPLSCSLPASMYHDWLGFFFSLNRFLDRNVFSLEAAGWERSCLFGNEYCPRTLDLRAAIFFSFLFFFRSSLFSLKWNLLSSQKYAVELAASGSLVVVDYLDYFIFPPLHLGLAFDPFIFTAAAVSSSHPT